MVDVLHAFIVLGISFGICVVNEVVAWYLVYRTDKYQRLKGSLLLAERRLEILRKTSSTSDKARKKKEARTELEMKATMKQVQSTNFYNMILSGVLMFLVYNVLSWYYKGVAVAVLPFAPLNILLNITQRGLPQGTNPQLMSATAMYFLCQMCMRTFVTRVFNFGLRQSLQNAVKDGTGNAMEKKTS